MYIIGCHTSYPYLLEKIGGGLYGPPYSPSLQKGKSQKFKILGNLWLFAAKSGKSGKSDKTQIRSFGMSRMTFPFDF